MNRALLIHAGAVGDFVMSLRVVAALRQAGAEHVTVLGRPDIARIAGPADGVDAIMDIELSGFHALFSTEVELPAPAAERIRDFDLAVNMLGGSCDATRTRLTEAGIRRVIDIDPRPRADWRGRVSDQWLADLQAAGIKATVGPPRIRLDQASRRLARQQLDANAPTPATPVAILHPGSGSRDKCWPLVNFIELQAVLHRDGWRVVFLLGPVEMERFSRDEIARLQATTQTITGRPLRESAALIAVSRLFLGNDSGMSHLAAALGIETVAIFGPTDPDTWRPLGERATIIRPATPGAWPSIEDVTRSLPPVV